MCFLIQCGESGSEILSPSDTAPNSNHSNRKKISAKYHWVVEEKKISWDLDSNENVAIRSITTFSRKLFQKNCLQCWCSAYLGEYAGIKVAEHVEALEQVLDLGGDPGLAQALLILLHNTHRQAGILRTS